jgi:acetyl/propionyl-CoA carboxylase alpha subunit
VEEGTIIGTEYDPLLAKLLAVGRDRPEALGRLRRALAEFEVAGLQTTLPFHAWIAAHPAFVAGDLSTSFVGEHWHPQPIREGAAARAAEAAGRWAATGSGGAAGISRPRPQDAPIGPGGPGRGAGWARAGGWAVAGRLEGVDRWPA